MVNVTCASCGTIVDIDSGRGFGFCVNCGTRLSVGVTGSSSYSGGCRVRVTILTPSAPAKLSGSFEYFGFIWDGVDQNTRRLSETLVIDTVPGTHTLEVRQLNGSLFGNKVAKTSGSFDVCGDITINVFAEGDHLVLSTSGSTSSYGGSSPPSSNSGLSIH